MQDLFYWARLVFNFKLNMETMWTADAMRPTDISIPRYLRDQIVNLNGGLKTRLHAIISQDLTGMGYDR
jgi:hypothetical protein